MSGVVYVLNKTVETQESYALSAETGERKEKERSPYGGTKFITPLGVQLSYLLSEKSN